jgi:Nif-specific regulatory protein
MNHRRSNEKAELSAIYEVGKILTSTQNLPRALGISLRTLQSFLGFDRAAIHLPDTATREIRMEVAAGYTAEERGRARYVWGEGIVGKTMKSGSPIAIPDVRQEPSFLDKTRAHGKNREGIVSYISVPLKIGAEVLGVLTAERIGRAGTQALEADARTLMVIGCIIGQALKLHAAIDRLQEEFQRQRQEFEKTIRKTYRIENIAGRKRMRRFRLGDERHPSPRDGLLRGGLWRGCWAIHLAGGQRLRHGELRRPGACWVRLFGLAGAFGAIEEKGGSSRPQGTIFLDGRATSPCPRSSSCQVLQKIQAARENKTISVDVRIIAPRTPTWKMVEEGRFREDLFYRLNVIPIFLPPLRDRREDVIPLAEYFLERFNKEHGKGVSFAPEVLDLLLEYRWPGNVRELENLVERAVVMAKSPVVHIPDLPRPVRTFSAQEADGVPLPSGAAGPAFPAPGGKAAEAPPRAEFLRAMEREELRRALDGTGWVIARAARVLGWTPRQVAYKMKKHSLSSPWKK